MNKLVNLKTEFTKYLTELSKTSRMLDYLDDVKEVVTYIALIGVNEYCETYRKDKLYHF